MPLRFRLFVPAGRVADFAHDYLATWTCGDRQGRIRLTLEKPPATTVPPSGGEGLFAEVDLVSRDLLPVNLEGPTLIAVHVLPNQPVDTLVSVMKKWRREALTPEIAATAPTPEIPPPPGESAEPVGDVKVAMAQRDETHVPLVHGLKVNEPVYIAFNPVHGLHGLDARFQLSLKYQMFDTDGPMRHLHAAVTITSLWDLHSFSFPFRDSTYRPAVIWSFDKYDKMYFWGASFEPDIGLFEHESNGRGPDPDQPLSPANNDALSRSMNRFYFTPRLVWADKFFGQLILAPKIFWPFAIDDVNNGDIAKYRGYADLTLKWLPAGGDVLSLLARQGTNPGRRYFQVDYGFPLRRLSRSRDANGWLLFQWLYGYGETLRDYNRRNPGTLRIGYMIVP
jgi:outer membrane phospholipase A